VTDSAVVTDSAFAVTDARDDPSRLKPTAGAAPSVSVTDVTVVTDRNPPFTKWVKPAFKIIRAGRRIEVDL
jgi:hypothetical protein